MAISIYYLDPEGGNDSNDGTTFANRWKTVTSGATAARIGPGDTIRVMASPDPVSIGNATWTNGPRPSSINISSSTNATPIEITTSGAHNLSANDYVSVAGVSSGNTNSNGVWKVGAVNSTTKFTIVNIDGTNTTGNGTGTSLGTITKINNCMVKFSSPIAKNIFCGGLKEKLQWTASANVTCAQNTTAYKEGYSSTSIDIAAAFTTGKAAYWTLPATLDLSTYQALCFWVQISAGAVNGGPSEAYLALCTDTTGDTIAASPDHKFNIPMVGALGIWVPVYVPLSSAMNSAIKSIAFYVATDKGAQTFLIDNIVAVGSTLNLASLIGKNVAGTDDEWYALQSLNYDVAMITNANSLTPTSSSLRGYYGTSETVTTWSRETIKLANNGKADNTVAPASTNATAVNTIQDSGSSGSPITFSGGWDRTNMSTQSGETWWDAQNGYGRNIYSLNKNYLKVEKINSVRFNVGFYIDGTTTEFNLESIKNTGCSSTTGAIDGTTVNNKGLFNNIWSYNNGGTGVFLYYGGKLTNGKKLHGNVGYGLIFSGQASADTVYAHNNGNSGIAFNSSASKATLINGEASYNVSYGINNAGAPNCVVVNYTTTGNGTSSTTTTSGNLYLNNCILNETVEASISNNASGSIFCNRLDGADNNSVIYTGIGSITQQSTTIDSPATTAWKLAPSNASNCTSATPLQLKLGTVICKASSLVTVTARMRRSDAGLTMSLVCPGGQITGVDSDVSSNLSASADTWTTVTITFTPTKPGAVDIYAYAYGGTTYNGYVCNITASQA